MTAQSNYFMADFAPTDKRSARAHLEGRNLRVPLYLAFEAAETLIGRADRAPADYKKISNYLYRKLPVVAVIKQRVTHFSVTATGLLAGMALSLYLFSQ